MPASAKKGPGQKHPEQPQKMQTKSKAHGSKTRTGSNTCKQSKTPQCHMSGLDWSLFVYLHLFELRICFACVEPVQVLELSASHGLLVLFEPMHMCIYIYLYTCVYDICSAPAFEVLSA